MGNDILKTSSSTEKDGNLLSTTFPGVSNGKESACNAGDLGWIPGLGRSPGGRHGNLLHGGIPMDRGAWQAAVHGVVKSRT